MNTQTFQVGATLLSLTKHVTLAKISQPLMALNNPLHYDQAFSEQSGLPAPIAAGMMSSAYLSEMLMKTFGAAWFAGSAFTTTFIQPVYAGDTLTTKGIVRDIKPVGPKTQVTVEVWCENQHGDKVTVGEATVDLP